MATERLDIVVSERGARRVQRNIAGIGRSARKAQGGVSLLRSALGALSGALILRSSIKTLAEFSQSMSTIKAITGEMGAVLDSMRNKAKELGIQTRFSATQAAEGMVFLARAGFNANESLQSIQSTLNLAQIGLIEVARAADIASNVLKGFRLEASSMERVVDVLAKTSSRSNTNIEQLGDAMSFAAPAAAALGISIETTAAAIGVLSDAGIQGTRAGSGLRTSFIKLLAGQGAARASLDAIGLSLHDVNIETRGLIPVLETLRQANIGLVQATELVGVRQANNLLIMIESLPRLKELDRLNIEAANSAKEMADIMDDNLNGALFRVQSALKGIILELGDEGGTGSLRTLLEKTAQAFRIVANNADILANALVILGSVILGRLVLGAITLLIGQLKKLGLAIIALSARIIPAMAAAAIAAFAILAAVAKANGESIEDTFEKMKDQVTGFFRDIIIPTDAMEDFSAEIRIVADALNEAGGAAKLSNQGIEDFTNHINDLKATISDQLLITEFLAPGSEAVERMKDQIETLDSVLKAFQDRASKKVTVETSVIGDSTALSVKLNAFRLGLVEEAELINLTNREREISQVLKDAEVANGGPLIESHAKLIEVLARENRALVEQRELIEDIKGPAQDYQKTMEALSGSLVKEELSERQIADARRINRIEFLDQQKDLVSGTERAFLKMGMAAEDLASGIERAITNAFKKAGDVLHEFVTTGRLDFSSLIDSIISDLARLAIQGAITGPLAKLLGTGDAGIGGEDSTKGLQGLFEKIFGGGGADVAGSATSGILAALPGTSAPDDGGAIAAGATQLMADAMISAAPAITAVTTEALKASTVLGGDLTQSSIKAVIGTAAETAVTEKLTLSLAQLALFSDTAAAALQRLSLTSGLEGGGGIQGLFDSLVGGAAGAAPIGGPTLVPGGSFLETASGFIGGFAHGGNFKVGGPAGTDNSIVKFKATRGEEVTVRTPAQQAAGNGAGGGGGGDIYQSWHIETPNVGGFNRSKHQIMGQASGGLSSAQGRG